MLIQVIQVISSITVPLIIMGICIFGYLRGVKIYDAFVEGAKDGLTTAVRILPFLVAMFTGIAMFRVSGAMNIVTTILAPIAEVLHIPRDVLPLAMVRPLSATGSLEVLTDILKVHGPDSPAGTIASMIQSSCETTFYVLTVYFGAVSITKVRHTFFVGIVADLLAIVGSVVLYYLILAPGH